MKPSTPPDDKSTTLNKFVVTDHKEDVLFSLSKTTLTIARSSQPRIECPLEQVIWAEVDNHELRVSLLRRQKGLALYSIVGSFDPALHEAAEQWSLTLMKAAYNETRPKRKLMVMVNPHGGSRKAVPIFEKKVKPIFEAARCSFDVLVTGYSKHCYEYTKSMRLDYDAIVVLSGDGLIHEIFNAFIEREDVMDAFATPVVQIPAGSANGLSLALLGLKDGWDVCAAALNVIKGKPMKLDLCSVQQGNKKVISFMSQAIGMMADIDLGTENLRWLGDTRFMVGFLREVGPNRGCRMKLEIKVAARDKQKIVETYLSSRSRIGTPIARPEPTNTEISTPQTPQTPQTMPPPDHMDDDSGWIVIDQMLSFVYAGKLPYASRDLMQFPVAISDDGLIDLVVQERISRIELLKALDGAAEGKQYWKPSQLYFKAKAYRLTPYPKDGHLSIDGEKYPYAPFEVYIHQRLGTTLGPGYWYPEFSLTQGRS